MADYFQASGDDACAVCQSLDGTEYDGQPHDNCQCEIVADDDCQFAWPGSSAHYPGDERDHFGVEITVTCADGSEIGESVPIDLSDYDGEPDGIFDWIEDQVEEIADELCSGCPDSDDGGSPDG
jgi:hypothetical protein